MKRIAAVALIVFFFLAPSIEHPTFPAPLRGLRESSAGNDSSYLAEGTGSFEGTGESLPIDLNGLYSGYGTASFDSSMPGYLTMNIPESWTSDHLTTNLDDLSMWVDNALINPKLDTYHNERWLFTGTDSQFNGDNFDVPDGWTLEKSDPATGSQHPLQGTFELYGSLGAGYGDTMGWEFAGNYAGTTPLEPTNEVYLRQQVLAPWRELYSAEINFLYYVRSLSDMDNGVHLFARFGDFVTKLEVFDTGDPVDTWIEAQVTVPNSYLQTLTVPNSVLFDIGLGTDISGQPGVGGSHVAYIDEIELRLNVRPFPEQINLKANGVSVKGSTAGSISPYVPDGANRDCYSNVSSGIDLNGPSDNGVLNMGANAPAFPDWSTAYAYQVGLQFPLDVPQGSAITSAYLEVEAETGAQYLTDTFDGRMRILVANENTVTAFTTGLPELTDRYNWVDTDIIWTPSDWTAGTRYASPNIAPILQKVVSRTDWQSGNYVCIMLEYAHSTNDLSWNNVKGSSNYPQADLSRLFVDYLAPESEDIVYSFEKSKTISIDHMKVAGDLYDFPVLVDIWDADLHTVVQPDGDDIGFMIGHETLDHEIVLFDRTGDGTRAHLVAWVRVPFLSSARNTDIVMLYGNRYVGNQETVEGVWDDDFVGVWHLDEDPAGTNFDSTSFSNDGTGEPPGNEPGYVIGKIGMSAEFYGATLRRVEVPHGNSLAIPGSVTVEAWVRTNNTDISSDAILAKWNEVGNRNYWLGKLDASTLAFFVDDTQLVSTAYSLINDGSWHHLVGVADATQQNLYLFVDGILQNTAAYTGSMQVGDSVLHIGNNPGSVGLDQEWDGLIDEARVSKNARTSEWVLTSYRNQISPLAFYSIGQESQIAWFDSDWSYRKAATVSADASNIPAGYSVHLTFDHAALVSEGKSLANGDDIRVVYWDGSQWIELDRMLDTDSTWNSDSTKIWFKTQTSIPASSSDSGYYLYYGNPLSSSPPSDSSRVFSFYDGFESGNLDGWNGSYTDIGDTLLVLNTPLIPVHSGTYAVRADVDNQAAAQGMVWWDFSDSMNLLARVHFYLPAGFSTTDHVTIMQYVDTSTGWQNQISVTIKDDMTLYMWNAIAGEAYGYMATSTISTGSWHMLEMQARISDTNGEARLWMDGNLEIEETGRNLGTEGIDRFCTVFYWASPQTEPNTIYADDAFLRPFLSPEPSISLGPELTQAIQFNFRKDIVIDHTKVNSDLEDFPLLIDIYDADLKTDVQFDGDDILFLKGSWILPHEIELFDPNYNSTHAHLVAWVKTDLLSSMDTVVSMYYGNPSAVNLENPISVWSNSYGAVWHMNDDPTGTIYDSTSNDNDGTSSGGMSSGDQIAGQIDGSLDFDGSNDGVSLPGVVIGNGAAWTISAWIRIGADTADQRTIYSEGDTGVSDYLFLYVDDTNSEVRFYSETETGYYAQVIGSTNVEDSQWHFVTLVQRSKANRELYIDGISDGNSTQDAGTLTTDKASIGVLDYIWGAADWFKGTIDEIRISDIARSADWITAEFNNQYSTASFFSIGSEIPLFETVGGFLYHKEIVIDHTKVDADLTDFPLLVDTYDTDLRFDAQADGDDIVFTKDGVVLPHEIELFNQSYNSTHAHLVAWIKTDVSSTADTTLSMLYGNPTYDNSENPSDVWSNNYAGVWHLNRAPSDGTPGGAKDSTANGNDGTPLNFQDGGGGSTDAAGQIDGAFSFGGDNDHVTVSNPVNTDQASQITISAWVKVDESVGGEVVTRGDSYALRVWSNGRVLFFKRIAGSWVNMAPMGVNVTGDGFHHLVAVQRPTGMFLYIDGQQVDSNGDTNSIIYDLGNDLEIGTHGNGDTGYEFLGIIDEVRVSTTDRSAAWISAEYANQNNPQDFYSIGSEVLFQTQGFANKKTITVDSSKVLADVNDFPLLVELFDEDLRAKVQPDGDDISFRIGDLVLDHEIEIFDQTYSPTHAHLVAWVRIPFLSSSLDTEITMLYGNPDVGSQENPAGVWSNRYAGVWHLSEDSGNALDSTLHGTQGTPSGGILQGTSGYIGQAYSFDGIDGTVNFGDPSDGHLDFGTSSFSYSIWVRIDSNTGTYQIPFYKGGSSSINAGYDIETSNDASSISSWISDGSIVRTTTSSPITFGEWVYLVAVVNRETNRVLIFRDGTITGSGSSLTSFQSLSTTQPFSLSRPGYELDGFIDEVRIAMHPLDPNWIYTEYLNQKDPSSFYSVGEESGTVTNEVCVGFTTNSNSAVSLSATMELNISSASQSLTNDLSPGISYSVANGTPPLWTAKIELAAPIGVDYLGFSINYPTAEWKPIAVTSPLGTQKTEYVDWIRSGQGLTVFPRAANMHGIWKLEFQDRNQIINLDMGLSGGIFSSTGTFAVGDSIRFRSLAPSMFGSITSIDLLDPSGAIWHSTEPAYQGLPFSLPFSHRKSIVIDHNKVASSLENFPVLIDLYDTDLVTDVRPDGADIAFAIGDLVLDHEIELFDQDFNGTHARLIAWIEVPHLSANADTTISMYYGNPYAPNRENPAGVWDSNYAGVWHLGEIGTGLANEYADSSIYANHGQGGLGNSSYVPTQTPGAIGFGQDFVDHFIDCGNDTSLDITGSEITLQLWMQYPATHPNMGPLNHKGWYNGYRLVMPQNSQNINFNLHGSDYSLGTSQSFAPNEWHHVVAVYNGTHMRFYIDGNPDPASLEKNDDILSALPEPFRIGHGDHPEAKAWSFPWLGQIDEVRVSSVARSSDWIWTEHQNQADPQSFVTIGLEESIGNYTTSDINLDASASEGLWTARIRYRSSTGLPGGSVGTLSRNFIVTHSAAIGLTAPSDALSDHIASREAGDEVYLEVELIDTVTSNIVTGATVTINWTVLGTPTLVQLNDFGNGRYGKTLNTSDLGEARRWRIEFSSYHQYYANATEYVDIDLSHRSYLTSMPPNPIPYGEDFIVKVNLRDAFDNSLISGATITSNGTFSLSPVDYGNGTYLISINSSGYNIGTHVFRITAEPIDPLVMSCFLDVTFTYRTIKTTAITTGSNPAEVPYGQTVNTTLQWYDNDNGGIGILGGTITSTASLQFIDLGDGSYGVTVDTSDYALGTHVIHLTVSKQNYQSATASITLNIIPHRTSLGLEINSTTPVGSLTYLSVSYIDLDGGSKLIPSGNLSLILVEWVGGSDTFFSYGFWLDTSGWAVGIHEINVTLQAISSPRFYDDALITSQVEVRKLNVFLTWEHLDPIPNGDDFEMFLHVNVTEPGTAVDGIPINGIASGYFSAENDTGSPYAISVTFLADGRYRLVIGGGAFFEGDYKITIFLDFLPAEIYEDTQTPMIIFTYRATRASLSSQEYPQVATTYNTNVTVSLHYVDLDRSLNITTGSITAQGASIVWQHVGDGYYDVIIVVFGWNQGGHSVNLTADAVGYEAKTLAFEVIVQIAYAYARPTVTSIDLPLGDTYTFYVDYWDITNDEPIIGASLSHNWTHSLAVFWTGSEYRVDFASFDSDPLGSYLILFNFSKGQNYQFGYFNVSINLRTHYTEFRLGSIVEPTSYAGVVNVSLYYGDLDNDVGIWSSNIDVLVRNQTGVISFLSLDNDTSLGSGYYILRISASVFGSTGLYNFTVYLNWTGPGPKFFNGTTSASVNIIGEESKLTLLDSPGPTAYLENMSYLYVYSELYSGDGISNYTTQDVHVYIVFVGESIDDSLIDIGEIDPVGNPGQYTIQFNSTVFGKPGLFTMIVYFNWSAGVAPYYPNKTSVVQVRVTARNTLLSVNPPDSTPYGVNATLSFTFDDATDVILMPIAKQPQMSVVLSLADYSLWYNDTTMTFHISFNTSVLGASIGSKSFTISVSWVGTPFYANVTNRVVLITVLYRETVIEYPTPPPTPFKSNLTLTVNYLDVTENPSVPIDGCTITLEDSIGTIPAVYYSVLALGGGVYEVEFNTTYFTTPGIYDLTVVIVSSNFYIPEASATRSLQIQYRLTTLTANPIGLIPFNDSLNAILQYQDLLTTESIGNGSQPIGIEILNGSSWEFDSQWRSSSQDYLVVIETYNQMLEIGKPYVLLIRMSYPDVAPFYRWSDVYLSFELRYRSSSLQLTDFPMPTAYLDLVNFTILYQDLDLISGIENGEIDIYYGITELVEDIEYFVNAIPGGEYYISIDSTSLAGLGSHIVQVRANWLLGAPYHRNSSLSVGLSIVERAARTDIVVPPNQAAYLDNLTFSFRYSDVSKDQSISITKSLVTIFSGGVQLQQDDFSFVEILGDYYVEINSTILGTGLVSNWNLTLVVNWSPLVAPFYTSDQASMSITTTNRIGLVTLDQPPTVPIGDNMSLIATFVDEGNGLAISGALVDFDCLNPSNLVENVDFWVLRNTQGEGSYEIVVDSNALGSSGTFTFRLKLLWDSGTSPYYRNTTTLYLTGSVRLVQALLTNDIPNPSIVPLYYNCSVVLNFTDLDHSVQITGAEAVANVRYKSTGLAPSIWNIYVVSPGVYQLTVNCSDAAASGTDALIVEIDLYPYQIAELQIPFQIRLRDGELIVRSQVNNWKGENAIVVLELVDRDAFDMPLSGASLALSWADSSTYVDLGNGLYEITLWSSALNAGAYTLQVAGSLSDYFISDISVNIEVRPIPAELTPTSNVPDVYWGENVTISAIYNDTLHDLPISLASLTYEFGTLAGSLSENTPGNYSFSLDTGRLAWATTYVVIITASYQNYQTATAQVTVNVLKLPTEMTLMGGLQSQDLYRGQPVNVTVFVNDTHNGVPLSGAFIEAYWSDTPGAPFYIPAVPGEPGYYSGSMNTGAKDIGTYTLNLVLKKDNYMTAFGIISVKIVQITSTLWLDATTQTYVNRAFNWTDVVRLGVYVLVPSLNPGDPYSTGLSDCLVSWSVSGTSINGLFENGTLLGGPGYFYYDFDTEDLRASTYTIRISAVPTNKTFSEASNTTTLTVLRLKTWVGSPETATHIWGWSGYVSFTYWDLIRNVGVNDAYAYIEWDGGEDQASYLGNGSYSVFVNTSLVRPGTHPIILNLWKENYESGTGVFNLVVLSVPTEIEVYADEVNMQEDDPTNLIVPHGDLLNVICLYNDTTYLRGITGATYLEAVLTHPSMISDKESLPIAELSGGNYTIGFDSSRWFVVDEPYHLIVKIGLENRTTATISVYITIVIVPTTLIYDGLSSISLSFGQTHEIRVRYIDIWPTHGNAGIENGIVNATSFNTRYVIIRSNESDANGGGWYVITISSQFEEGSSVIRIILSKQNHQSSEFSITIAVEPSSTDLLIQSAILYGLPTIAIVILGAILWSRVFRLPEMLKKLNKMIKALKHGVVPKKPDGIKDRQEIIAALFNETCAGVGVTKQPDAMPRFSVRIDVPEIEELLIQLTILTDMTPGELEDFREEVSKMKLSEQVAFTKEVITQQAIKQAKTEGKSLERFLEDLATQARAVIEGRPLIRDEGIGKKKPAKPIDDDGSTEADADRLSESELAKLRKRLIGAGLPEQEIESIMKQVANLPRSLVDELVRTVLGDGGAEP
ncbi:MAG: DUF2341 domain-containing protein [Candidatus Hermodarchaeota archaeon]